MSRLAPIKEHATSNKHKNNLKFYSGHSKVNFVLPIKNVNLDFVTLFRFLNILKRVRSQKKQKKLMICAFLAEHNIPFLVMDHLSEVISEAFHDSETAKSFACKRTKTAHLIYDVMGPVFQEKLLNNLRSDVPRFSIIIDESTVKILALTVMFYLVERSAVETKFLSAIQLEGETAEIIFNTLITSLKIFNLNIEDVLGFASDTTNVIFGQNNSIVSRIKEANPNCVFIKCVCHSVALAVSYACKE
ncbi:hypothetical protein NQ314_005959 [Rhamnusium bicolor]|uniref:DUF4371 domain-containing protein n=1 Tax=Rhamnusium bicolor TaxID=1586634 RepID=A0AAV8ZCG1_9CUCU|nr:hypothetical protein NQ314_005959 [Rhamnusium bicolor]